MGFELTEQQKDALIRTKNWWLKRDKPVWEISGAAGTGKTTIVYHLIKEIGLLHNEVLFVAYVGKATLALSRKGNLAKTIHSAIYDMVDIPELDANGKPILVEGRPRTTITFMKKDRLPSQIKLIVVDEAAMVSEKMAFDILSYGIPVIALGDRNQLDPVFGTPYFLRKPDVILTEPMRQSLDSPILYLAGKAMRGEYIKKGQYGNCYVIDKEMITDDMVLGADCVICGRNTTRDKINRHIRHDVMKYKTEYPVIGEKLICRQNNWKLKIDDNIFLINGMVGYMENIYLESYNGRSIEIDFRPDFMEDEMFTRVEMDYRHITEKLGSLYTKTRSYYNKFEYAYAISTHLSQGSEWDNVLVYDEACGTADYRKKSLYTAITRAKKQLILAI